MRLYLDDCRPAPHGWTLARSVDEAISYLRQGKVTDLSLDYDLGNHRSGTGMDVLLWLESAIAEGKVSLPQLTVHSGLPLGRRRLEATIALLQKRFGR